MSKLLILDSYYPEFIRANPINPAISYQSNLAALLNQGFGTADFFSRNLNSLGFECADIIVNHQQLQNLWAFENSNPANVLKTQIEAFQPDVIFLQDLSIRLPDTKALIAAQCSCALPRDDSTLRRCDVVFTSLPKHLDEFEKRGIRSVFLPLAFEPAVLDRIPEPAERDIDVSFVGGLSGWQWDAGTKLLEVVAALPTVQFYGYGYENAPKAVRDRFRGPAWGNEMYSIYRRSKLVINRHGEISAGYSNNLRMFESTGCGAVLVTERSKNLHDFFSATEAVAYSGPEEAVYAIRGLLRNEPLRKQIAENGQARTLRDHTYAQRMKIVSSTLMEMLVGATK